jgi:hypothetical protein
MARKTFLLFLTRQRVTPHSNNHRQCSRFLKEIAFFAGILYAMYRVGGSHQVSSTTRLGRIVAQNIPIDFSRFPP